MSDDLNRIADRVVGEATGTAVENTVAKLAAANEDWRAVLRAILDWTLDQRERGNSGQFARSTIYFQLDRRGGQGPPLTPLVRAGLIGRAWVNARGRPYYELLADPDELRAALS